MQFSSVRVLAVVGVWLLVIGIGSAFVSLHQNTPGVPASSTPAWPDQTGLERGEPFTLVLLLHPKCPCSVATLAELEKILMHSRERLDVLAVFTVPEGVEPGWEQGRTWNMATAMRGVRAVADQGGEITKKFGAATSGQTLLYSADGRLLYSGGITGARGHEGENAGAEAVVKLVNHAYAPTNHPQPVFGCPIFIPEKTPSEQL